MHRTAEEVSSHYTDCMGRELGKLFYVLQNELVWLYAKWREYVVLYGTKESRVDLLNKAAPHFFRIVQDSLWEDTILHITRITGPEKSMGKENLTVRRLPRLIADPEMRQRISDQVIDAVNEAKFCVDWRNRRIAHADLALSLQDGAEPLQPASREKIHQTLRSIAKVLNSVAGHYTESEIEFDIDLGSDGAESLLHVLDDGLKAEAARQERWARGEIQRDDFKPRDL